MRDTVFCLIGDPSEETHERIRTSVKDMVAKVATYVPATASSRKCRSPRSPEDRPVHTLAGDAPVTHQVSVFLEVEGAAHYLPAYAGNLDIMTSAALRAAERMAIRPNSEVSA